MTQITLTFLQPDGTETMVQCRVGDLLLRVAQEAGIELEGACNANMACSTCHLIMDPQHMADLPAMSIEEEEMLDLAPGLSPTSRLSCQIDITPGLDGARICVPAQSNNMMGF